MMDEPIKKYWNLLNDAEDLLTGGFRGTHPEVRVVNTVSGGETEADNPALNAIALQVHECTRCGLSSGRTQGVPGAGVPNPAVMIVGEGPGAEEDRLGLPFVGPAGKYLDKWLEAIGLSRSSNCFIANVVKCRPPGNRDPAPEESSAC
ncbi:MAG: uracil-DNA glycosylase, partial [Spirochaetales bacterium]|nr:uracil-DNA glycosylase [Spirochaetales bacterium]